MAEEKMERVVLSEEELDKTAGGYRPFRPSGWMLYQRTAAGNEECEKLMSGFAQDKAENAYSND